jgi:hypothetical protein
LQLLRPFYAIAIDAIMVTVVKQKELAMNRSGTILSRNAPPNPTGLRHYRSTGLILMLAGAATVPLAAPSDAHAAFVFRRPANGKVTEYTPAGQHWKYTVEVTDDKGNIIDAQTFPQTQHSFRGEDVSFNVPPKVQKKGTGTPQIPLEFVDVKDVSQEAEKISGTPRGRTGEALGEINVLNIESVVRDPDNGKYGLENIFGTLAERVGFHNDVRIPDLVSDTNGDGAVGGGDKLYSLVDLNVYLDNVPAFTSGEVFNIVNGSVDGLPGMMFATVPFVFSEDTGWTFAAGRSQFTGTGSAMTAHGVSAVPEPSAMIGLGAIAALHRARRRREQE